MKVRGLDRLKKKLNKGAHAQHLMARANKECGEDLLRIMQKNAQPGRIYVKGYSEGNTRDALTLEYKRNVAKVRMNMPYNEYTEYGTRFMEAEPIIAPSLEELKHPHRRRFRDMIRKILGG